MPVIGQAILGAGDIVVDKKDIQDPCSRGTCLLVGAISLTIEK